jgi:hypothetical protein
MNDQPDNAPVAKRLANKATMDQPQEEFIAPYAARVDRDGEDEEKHQETKPLPPPQCAKN